MSASDASPSFLSRLRSFAPPRTATLRLTYRAEGTIRLKSPPASVWRGQLGEFLHRIAPTHHHDNNLSLYRRLFRTPRAAVDLPKGYDERMLGRLGLAGDHVPHPFVMRMASAPVPGQPLQVAPGDAVGIELTLMEAALETVPALCAAFESLATNGIGSRTEQPGGSRRRGRAVLTAAVLDTGGTTTTLYDGSSWTLPPSCSTDLLPDVVMPQPCPDADAPVTLALWTPLRLTHRRRVVGPGDVSVPALGAAFFRRLVGLAVCYSPMPPSPQQATTLLDAFFALGDATTVTTDVRWAEDSRYSARQGTRHPTGGLVGSIRLEGTPDVNRSWRLLAEAVAPLHLGTQTALGLGSVEPVPAGAPADA
ncbi:hypothetical protein [Salisaeta longa]|uniref:hypothetical protein n=1 Tax=Salisaeta longa TaxID=503170 RepID=UPI0003B474C9|nr:hypothetical protein [Salisaeta longa]